jgi:hypothetical protein
MRKGHICLFLPQFLKYISLAISFWAWWYIVFLKKPWHGSHPTLGENEGFSVEKIKTIVESMVKWMLKMKVQWLRKC